MPVFFLFLILIGNMSEKLLMDQVLQNTDEFLFTLSKREALEIDKYFSRIEKLGNKSAGEIGNWIKKGKELKDPDFNKKYKKIDGALRTNLNYYEDKDISGVFLSNSTPLTDEIKNIITSTEARFEQYAKAAKSFVFNTYLITKHQLARVYEKDWVFKLKADYDFKNDSFYNIALPKNNPERKGKWIPPYYDSVIDRWMTSLIVPIYIEDEFIGIVGHDVVLDEIYESIKNRKYYETGYGFIFDKSKNIVVHPEYTSLLKQPGKTKSGLNENKSGDNLLFKLISDIVESGGEKYQHKKIYDYKGEKHYVYTTKLNILDWYYSIKVTESKFLKTLPEFRKTFLFLDLVITFLLFILVVFVMWILVVKPIKKLKTATENIIAGDFKQTVSVSSNDEIGELTASFNHMIKEINNKIKDVNDARDSYKEILINSEEAIFQSSLDGKFLNVNPAVAKILGYKDEEDLLFSITDIENQLYVKKTERKKLIEQVENSSTAHHCEIQVYKKDGSQIWIELREKGIKDKNNNLKHIEGFFNDITERKRSEEVLTISNTILKTQQQTSPDGILIVDENLNIVDYNQRFVEMWGIPDVIMKTKDEAEARKYVKNKLVDPDQFNERILKLYQDSEEKSYDIIELKNEVYYERYSSPLISKEGKILGRIWYFHDITVNLKIQKDLIKAKEKAESSDKLKSEFLAQVSHEIRTPINAVLSFSQLMKEELADKIDDDLKDGFRTIDHAGRRIIRTIDLILNMSELQSGSYDYMGRPINIYEEIILGIYSEYKHLAKEKSLDMEIIRETNLFNLIADEYTVTQIFSNLLDNAIKYTMTGSVKIILSRDKNEALIVEVKDTGIGISKEYLPNLFKEFTQEEQGYTRKYEGNGLGLALVKKYCELNNAEISVESTKNIGTTFKVKFEKDNFTKK